jgi:hypothetical protein
VDRSRQARPRVRFELVPKPGGVRVLSCLDADLDRDYAAAVVSVAASVEDHLGAEVVANRVETLTDVPPHIVLRSWRAARARFERTVLLWPPDARILRTDVARCYETIEPAVVVEALLRAGVASRTASRCALVLDDLAAEGVGGLPIGPAPSAVLANAVLSFGDQALRRAGAPFVRWVDDWWIVARSAPHAGELLGVLGRGLEQAGLRLHEAKTRLLEPDERPGPGSGQGYHRAAHAHPLPVVPRSHPVVPGDRRVGARRRAARAARRER